MNIGTSSVKTKENSKQAESFIPFRRDKNMMIRCAAAFIVGFLCSFGKIIGFPCYMNIAAAAAAGRYAPAVLAGALLSCLLGEGAVLQAVQIGSMLTLCVLGVFFPDLSRDGEPVRLSLTTAGITILFSCIISAGGADRFTISMRILNSLLCACIVYAAAFIAEKWRSGEPLRISGMTAVFLAMIYIAAVTTLCSCRLGRFDLGRILACAVIPAAAKKRRAAGGSVMGALTAVAVTMCSAALAVNTMLLAAAGLICSAFADVGKIACAAAFMLSAAAALAASGLNGDTFNMLTDIIVGAGIFAAVPSGIISKLTARFMIVSSPADCAEQTAAARLTFAAMTISDIRRRLMRVSETVEERTEHMSFGERVTAAACCDCRLYNECDENGCSAALKNACDTSPTSPNFPKCARSPELPSITAACREREIYDRAETIRMKELNLLLHEQLAVMSDVLNDLSCRISKRRETDIKLSAAAKNYFVKHGFKGVQACVYTDGTLGRHAEIYINGEFTEETLPLTAGLCRTLEIDLELPGVTSANGLTKLEFDELPPYSIEFGSWSAAGRPDICSGDSIETISVSSGERYVLLSDGMGSGRKAKLDSEIAVNLAGRLLKTGISMSSAQRVINSVMQSMDSEESFATLDLLSLDLFAGKAYFLKSGAAPAYLCRDGSMIRIASDSYPTGIFTSADPDTASVKLFGGDMLILATDGAPEKGLEEAARLYFTDPAKNAEDIACGAGNKCRILTLSRPDDMTIAVIKISSAKKKYGKL